MTAYRIYTVDSEDRVSGLPQIVECADDQQAIRHARECLHSKPLEVWNEAKRVVRLEPKD